MPLNTAGKASEYSVFSSSRGILLPPLADALKPYSVFN